MFDIEHNKDFLGSVKKAFENEENEEDEFFSKIPKFPYHISFKPDWWEDKPFLLHWKLRGLTCVEVDNQIENGGSERRFLYYHEEDEERIFEEEKRRLIEAEELEEELEEENRTLNDLVHNCIRSGYPCLP